MRRVASTSLWLDGRPERTGHCMARHGTPHRTSSALGINLRHAFSRALRRAMMGIRVIGNADSGRLCRSPSDSVQVGNYSRFADLRHPRNARYMHSTPSRAGTSAYRMYVSVPLSL